ncbi:MAG: helix-turn-helix domain-containing protein [Planctomycetota bacterium]|nr:helix-turn-helix domain-containing protein [Planctomycetota bacterium]
MTDEEQLQKGDFFANQFPKKRRTSGRRIESWKRWRKRSYKAMDKHEGNISHAAKLGLTRASLYRQLEKYGL